MSIIIITISSGNTTTRMCHVETLKRPANVKLLNKLFFWGFTNAEWAMCDPWVSIHKNNISYQLNAADFMIYSGRLRKLRLELVKLLSCVAVIETKAFSHVEWHQPCPTYESDDYSSLRSNSVDELKVNVAVDTSVFCHVHTDWMLSSCHRRTHIHETAGTSEAHIDTIIIFIIV